VSQNEVAVSVATLLIAALSACLKAFGTGGIIQSAGPPTPNSAKVDGTGGREALVAGFT
jgi:hypothetical protein